MSAMDDEIARENGVGELAREVEARADEFLCDGGDYGYGGEFFSRKEIDASAIAWWAFEYVQRAERAEAQLAAVRALVEEAEARPFGQKFVPARRLRKVLDTG